MLFDACYIYTMLDYMMCVHVPPHKLCALNTSCLLSKIQGSRWSTRLIGAPPENEGIGALPANLVAKERANRSEREESSRGHRRSFKVSKETSSAFRMSVDA